MIPTAAIYVFLIIAFFVARWIFWASLAAILLYYFFAPAGQSNPQSESVFTNLTWVALAIVIFVIILAIIGVAMGADYLSQFMGKSNFKMQF